MNLKSKEAEAQKVIIQHSSAGAFVGFTPIPFSDAPILLANQAGMIARILYIYNLKSLLSELKGLVGSVGLPTLFSSSGVWISAQLLKLIPGLGTLAAGMITGAVAGTLTSAIGFATSELCFRAYALALEGKENDFKDFLNQASEIFSTLLKQYLPK